MKLIGLCSTISFIFVEITMFLYKFFCESFLGRTLYHLSGRKILSYAEEDKNYVIPENHLQGFELSLETGLKWLNEKLDGDSKIIFVQFNR